MKLTLFIALIFCLVSPAPALSQPTSRPADDLRVWFKQLSDQSPDVRERARIELMSMPRARLNDLKRVVTESRPLTAAQAVELRQIVEHVFLSGEEYSGERDGSGFLGVRMAPISVPESETGEPSSNSRNRVVRRIMVTTRFPGFNAYSMLRDGDVILSVIGSPAQIEDLQDLPSALSDKQPGTTIELEVQRAGQLMRVPVRLSRRPTFLSRNREDTSNAFMEARLEAATKYWDENFASLLDQQTL